jgi:hypothetical protein
MLLAALLFSVAASAMAEPSTDLPALPQPGDPAWKPLRFRSIETPTRYEVRVDPDGRPAFRAISECGASAMRLALPETISAARTPRLAWRWRIEEALDVADETTRSGDDFAARVYVLFPFEPGRHGMLDRLQRQLGHSLFGVEMPGQTLNYVWSSRAPIGQSWTSPHHADARLVAVATSRPQAGQAENSANGEWSEIVVDWAADAEREFEDGPRAAPYALAIMVDADAVCGRAVAWFSDFRLLGPESAEKRP